MASTWRDRFRIPAIYDAVVASAMPDRGMIVGGFDGQTIQVHAWEVPSGRLRAVSTGPTGTFEGWIAPDGSWVYGLSDQQSNELGHLVRAPFGGGAVQDVTPELGSYTVRGVGLSTPGTGCR